MRRCAELERIEHTAEAAFDVGGAVTGDGECLVHDVGPVIANRARRQLDAVADDVVLERFDRQRVLAFERIKAALRHREGIVRELDLAGFLVAFVHREIDDPTEFEDTVARQIEIAAEFDARGGGERPEYGGLAGDEEYGLAVLEAKLRPQTFGAFGAEIGGYRAGAIGTAEEDVTHAGLTLALRPGIHAIAEGAIATARCWNRPDAR